jgi:hypothetical protein
MYKEFNSLCLKTLKVFHMAKEIYDLLEPEDLLVNSQVPATDIQPHHQLFVSLISP